MNMLKENAILIKAGIRLLLIVLLIQRLFVDPTSWMTLVYFIALAVSYIFFKTKHSDDDDVSLLLQGNFNPYKGKVGAGYLTNEKEKEVNKKIAELFLYDANNVGALKKFQVVKENTQCAFAKKAKLWGSSDYNDGISLEENVKGWFPIFFKFTLAFQDLALDGFLIELPGHLYGNDIKVFGEAVCRTLLTLKTCDNIHKVKLRNIERNKSSPEALPVKKTKEDPKNWENKFWVFEVNRITFFITTFAPFYPETNSRYSFGAKDCFILFQPEISFAIHDLPPDTPNTNWVCPVTVRDRIRVAFHNAGREYEPPMVKQEPMVYDIVKRINPEDESVKWWLSQENETSDKTDVN